MRPRTLWWRRTDLDGLERLVIKPDGDGFVARGALTTTDEGGFALTHEWRLDSNWSAQSLRVACEGPEGPCTVLVERSGAGWRVDGQERRDLDGGLEPDLSATPLCNSFSIRHMGDAPAFELDAVYIFAPALTVELSHQRYERLGSDQVRYVDLGASAGFTAILDLDEDGFVSRYEHLFERVEPVPPAS